MQKSRAYYIFLISAIAAIGGLLIGYDTAVISGAEGHLKTFFKLNDIGEGLAVSSALFGCLGGALIAGWMSNYFGRKSALIIAAVLFTVSAIGSAFPGNFEMFLVYRIIGGIGVGVAGVVSTMYIGEVSPKKKRGFYISFYQMAVVIGIFGVYFVNYAIAKGQSSDWLEKTGWRWMLGSEALVSALYFILLFFVPKSPRWLVENNRTEEAKEVLAKIGDEENAIKVLAEIQMNMTSKEKGGFPYFKKSGMLLALMIGIALSVFQQFVGINAVLYYAPEIFNRMGYDSDSSYIQTVIGGGVNFVFTILAIYTIDSFGRKPLLLWGSAMMGIFMILLGYNVMNGVLNIYTLVYMYGFIAAFAMSWGPVVWVMIAEMYPLKIKGLAMSIAIFSQYVANVLVTFSFPILRNVGGEGMNESFAYFLYGGFAFISWIVIKRFAPETKGRSLEEMGGIWESK